MKNRILYLLLVLVLIVTSFSFAACDVASNENGETESETQSGGPATSGAETEPETEPVEVLSEFKLLENGKLNYSLVRSEVMSDDVKKSVMGIYNYLLTVVDDGKVNYITDFNQEYATTGKHDETTYEIVFGDSNYQDREAAKHGLPIGSYRIEAIGRKIYVVAWSDEALIHAIDDLLLMIKGAYDETTGSITLTRETLVYEGTHDKYLNAIPGYTGGELSSIYDCGDDCTMVMFDDTNKAEFNEYLTVLEDVGYKEYASSEMNENLFATLTRNEEMLNLVFLPKAQQVRIISETTQNTALYPIEEEYTKVCDSMLIQVGVTPSKTSDKQNGMCYLLRLEDGSFLVFDGGFKDGSYDDYKVKRENGKRIYQTILANTPGGKKPKIKAWILTHMHEDHIGAFRAFINMYGEKFIDIEYMIYNQPADDQLLSGGKNPSSVYEMLGIFKNKFPSCKLIKTHPGQTMQFANVKMEVLYTLELYAPNNLTYLNTSSLVCKLYIGDQTFLMTGDMSEDANNIICRHYGSYIKSDILQVPHHGSKGGSVEFTKLVDPTWVLWPMGEGGYLEKYLLERNRYFIESENIKKIFVSAWRMTTLNFPFTGLNYTEIPIS